MLQYDLEFLKENNSIQKYVEIMSAVKTPGFKLTDSFKKKFNGFYRIGIRSEKWYSNFYFLFGEFLKGENHNFSLCLNYLYTTTGKIEPSFCSKLIHTFNPNLPIWDSFILRSLGFNVPNLKNSNKKIDICVKIYNMICREFKTHLDDSGVKAAIEDFDKEFSDYKSEISDVKKLDFILWSNRSLQCASILELSKVKDDLECLSMKIEKKL